MFLLTIFSILDYGMFNNFALSLFAVAFCRDNEQKNNCLKKICLQKIVINFLKIQINGKP